MLSRQSRLVVAVALLAAATVAPVGLVGAAGPGAPAAHGGGDCAFPDTSTDATGTNVTVQSEPERIVVLGPSAAQIAWEVGARERVVGIDSLSTYLDGSADVPVVARGLRGVDYEAALAQDPDLVVVAGNSYDSSVAAEFRSHGVPTYKMPSVSTMPGIQEKVETAGQLYGACEGAAETVAWMEQRLAVVREATADVERPSLFYDVYAAEDSSARYSAGPTSFAGEVISLAGADNVVTAANFTSPFPKVGAEYILTRDPEWILTTYTPSFGNASAARATVEGSDVLSQTTAVAEDQVIAVNANYLSQPAPRVIYALENVTKRLHPDAYRAATSTTESATTTAGPTATPAEGTSAPGVPGFGVGSALAGAALAGGAALARRLDQ